MTVHSTWGRPCHLVVLLGCLAYGGAGCGGSNSLGPSISPEEVAARAMERYDKNGDGVLDAAELEECPAVKSALQAIDTDKDGKVSAKELAARLTRIVESRGSRAPITVQVFWNDQPLEGATVRLVPESFLGDAFQPATGTTDNTGVATPKLAGTDEVGVPWGYYGVEVSKKSDGKETLPDRYNVRTTLGCEVSTLMRGGTIVFRLRS